MKLSIPRLSRNEDILIITVLERLVDKENFQIEKNILVYGQLRSYNKVKNGKLLRGVLVMNPLKYFKIFNKEPCLVTLAET